MCRYRARPVVSRPVHANGVHRQFFAQLKLLAINSEPSRAIFAVLASSQMSLRLIASSSLQIWLIKAKWDAAITQRML